MRRPVTTGSRLRAGERCPAILLAACLILRAAHPAFAGPATPTSGHHHRDHATVRHSFDDVRHWQSVFDDPARDAWQKPGELVGALQIRPGMTVADIGAGTGYFSRYLATAVGDAGTVFAVDPEPRLVAHLRERAEQEGTGQVIPVLGSPDNPRLPAGAVDLVLIVNTLHHIDGRTDYFRRLQRALKPGGRIAVVDFKKEPLPVGPPPEHKLAPEQAIDEFSRAGYQLVDRPELLPYQYVLVFAPTGSALPPPTAGR
ncbi:methyltransferase domain-containing protein [Candidatus Binatia bacterium]|nr:methyltransferase domain-containing protein [Candidatus Binatia bacterium]